VNVRFLNNFIISVTKTIIGDKLIVCDEQHHIKIGEIYKIDRYTTNENKSLNLYFSDSCTLAGVAFRVEKDYCEILDKKINYPFTGGCGGCGGR
jgi:hypothetical protein